MSVARVVKATVRRPWTVARAGSAEVRWTRTVTRVLSAEVRWTRTIAAKVATVAMMVAMSMVATIRKILTMTEMMRGVLSTVAIS